MKKSESILLMEQLEMNCLDYFITKNKQEITHYLAKNMNTKLSLRTERGEEYACPFYYMVPGSELLDIALKHIAEGYTIIIAPSLSTKGCEAFGSIMLTDGLAGYNGDIIEVVFGEGKCRDLDTHPDRKTFEIPIGKLAALPFKEWGAKSIFINKVYNEVRDKCAEKSPCVVEFSYYAYPVGRRNKNAIFWEVRNAK